MIDDGQFYSVVKQKMSDKTINSTQTLLRIPGEYEKIANHKTAKKLPMSDNKDILFTDEEVGVVALKNGDEILYASLYWRANYAINFLARVHYITPQCDRIATVFEDVEFEHSGLYYTRPERTNLAFSQDLDFYNVKSAHTGEKLPIAKIPSGVSFKPGDENVFAGKGDFYKLKYGKYIIAMNCTRTKTFNLDIPDSKEVLLFPEKSKVDSKQLTVEPMQTIVLVENK